MNQLTGSENPDPLSAQQLALARHYLYALLGQLFLRGLTAELFETIQAIPELAHTVAVPFDVDEAAAAHQDALGFHVFPYQSVFLATTGLLGGAEADRVLHSYRAAGFSDPGTGEIPDHIGHELAFLAFLCGAEADAWRDGLASESLRAQRLQRDFLEQNLLHWLAPFVLAVSDHTYLFYSALATLTLEFVSDHYADLSQFNDSPHFALPAPPALPGNSETSLKDIVSFLLTPAYSGLFIGRDDLAQMARRHHIPRGFGDRSQILANLLRAAGTYDTLPPLMEDVTELARQWHTKYDRYVNDFPATSHFVIPWREQTSTTIDLLVGLEQSIVSTPQQW